MIPITDSETAAKARYELENALREFTNWQLLDGDAMVASIEPSNFEFSVEWGKLIFTWWDDARSQSFRVIAYRLGKAEAQLQVIHRMARGSTILTLRDAERWRRVQESEILNLSERRKRYARLLSHSIATNITRVSAPRVSMGRYARLSLQMNGEKILAIGASDAETQPRIDGIIAAGLVWLTNFNCRPGELARRLWFCLPLGRSQTAIERLSLIEVSHLGALIECLEFDERSGELKFVRPATQYELLNTHPRELSWPDLSKSKEPHQLSSEAWLESILRRDIRALEATLDERFVYSQIPTWRGEERSVIDLLTINHQSRLVVIEVKAAEDPHLPIQGLDYWLRVEQARARGEFERRGLFPGIKIAKLSPLLYLIAPRLRFHRTFSAVARCLAPEIEAYQIGINANWHDGVHVRTIERINIPEERSRIQKKGRK
jgi:hypothetical protein